jgi:hypothetical protein
MDAHKLSSLLERRNASPTDLQIIQQWQSPRPLHAGRIDQNVGRGGIGQWIGYIILWCRQFRRGGGCHRMRGVSRFHCPLLGRPESQAVRVSPPEEKWCCTRSLRVGPRSAVARQRRCGRYRRQPFRRHRAVGPGRTIEAVSANDEAVPGIKVARGLVKICVFVCSGLRSQSILWYGQKY